MSSVRSSLFSGKMCAFSKTQFKHHIPWKRSQTDQAAFSAAPSGFLSFLVFHSSSYHKLGVTVRAALTPLQATETSRHYSHPCVLSDYLNVGG